MQIMNQNDINTVFDLTIERKIVGQRLAEVRNQIELLNKLLNLRDYDIACDILLTCACEKCKIAFQNQLERYRNDIVSDIHKDNPDENMNEDYLKLKTIQQYIVDDIKRIGIEETQLIEKMGTMTINYNKLTSSLLNS